MPASCPLRALPALRLIKTPGRDGAERRVSAPNCSLLFLVDSHFHLHE
jgi:hypothetical protein